METRKVEYARHGDLIFSKIDNSIDLDSLNKVGSKSYILAHGEVTNHKHVITAETGTVDIYKDPATNELVVVIDGKALITHEEHHTIELPTGTYRMKHQQEYNYFEMNSQKVID